MMLTCSDCGREFKAGMKGWYGRVEGLGPGGRTGAPLTQVLLCPDDFKKVPVNKRLAWHEFTGKSTGPAREKRPGHLGETG